MARATPLPRLGSHAAALAGALAAAGLGAGGAAAVALQPGQLRELVAGGIAIALLTLVFVRPRTAVLATVGFLVVLAFLRRILISAAGWSALDPLLLVGPVVAVVLMVRLFVLESRPLAVDGLSKLVLAVLGLTILEIGNPTGGGLVTGLGGFLFLGMPLLWFFIGRELATDALTGRLLWFLVSAGAVIALYGILQSKTGFPSWDIDWLNVTGYSALNVGDEIKPFGTFSSSAEYSLFLGSGLAVAAAFVLRGRGPALLALLPLAVGLFLSSTRSALITAFSAIIVLVALRPRRPVIALVAAVLSIGGSYGALKAFSGDLSRGATQSGSALVNHQVAGLTDPLNPSSSTLLVHLQLVRQGFEEGLRNPIGSGTASTNQAGGKLGGASGPARATEVDLSNAFVALGLLGGLLYLAVVVVILVKAVRGYFAGHELLLPVIGVLIVGAGQWLTGGHYALSPLTWLLIGWMAAVTTRPRSQTP